MGREGGEKNFIINAGARGSINSKYILAGTKITERPPRSRSDTAAAAQFLPINNGNYP